MAKSLTPIDVAANDTPDDLIATVNSIVSTIATEVVTVNASSVGGLTVGNGYVTGILGASVLVGGELRGGAVNASANLVLSSNITATNVLIAVGNSVINTISVTTENLTVNNANITLFTTGKIDIGNSEFQAITFQANASANQVWDQFPKANYRSAKYFVSLEDVAGVNFHLMEVLVIHDGTNAYLTEYGIVTTNGVIGTVNTVISGSNVQMLVSPSVANCEVQATRIVMST